MKPNTVTCLLFLFCVINLFFGCSQQKAAPLPELEQAEAVMFDHPDSALHILQRMPKPTDKEQHALWCLLMTQAMYKQYLPFSSDSLIRIAYDFYKPTDDARRKAMAALYMGDVNYELQKIETAMAYYLEAKDEVGYTDDYALGYLVMSSLGDLYLYRNLADYALEVIQKAYDYAVKTPYLKYKAYALRDMARVYTVKDQLDSIIIYYYKAIEETQKANLPDLELAFENELASIYVNNGEYQKALDLSTQQVGNYPLSTQSLYRIGVIYMNQKKYDSAYFYLSKALNTSNIYRRAGVYQSLLHLSRQPQYQKYMIGFYDSLRIYEDSVQKLDKSKEIIIYRGKYEEEKLVTEKQQLELEKANALRWLLFSVLIGVVLLSLLLYFYQRRKLILHRKEEELNYLTLRLRENELLSNRRYISELEAQAEKSREAVGQLKEQKERLAFLRQDNEALTAQVLAKEAWLSALRKKPVYLDEAGAKKVRMITDKVYTDFTRRLSSSIPMLSEYDLTLCCLVLVKLRFPVSDIAVLLGISSSSVSTSKLRAKKKIYETIGIADKKSLDQWLGEF